MEEWKDIEWTRGLYQVSSYGRVKSSDRIVRRKDGIEKRQAGRILKTSKARPHVNLCIEGKQISRRVSVLVAEAFLGPRPAGLRVCHWDGDSTNNRLENLRYGTPKENEADKLRHGRRASGERNGKAQLTEEQVAEIRRRVSAGETQAAVAAEFGVTQGYVSQLVNGKRR